MQIEPNSNIKKISIIDDDIKTAKFAGWQVEDAGYEPVIIEGQYQDVESLVDKIKNSSQGALCDHRLSHYGMANFPGAELVAALYDIKIPAILITQYIDIDKDVSIREWRRRIPILLSRDEADPEDIKNGILQCKRELEGTIPSIRKSHRTILRVTEINDESREKVVDVIVPAWNPKKAVRFPMSLIPEAFKNKITQDTWLFARVNIGAEKSEDLYFEPISLAPEPDGSNGLS